jgi:biotin synthase
LNFYPPNPALPIKSRNINRDEAIEIIQKARSLLGEERLIMVAGGRELLFNGHEDEMFKAGANSMVIGDYLTTEGLAPSRDKQMLESLGYEVATSCDTQ